MNEEKIILHSTPEAAEIKTVTGWVSRNGKFWGEHEDAARYDGCTHKPCRFCGEAIHKRCRTFKPGVFEKKNGRWHRAGESDDEY